MLLLSYLVSIIICQCLPTVKSSSKIHVDGFQGQCCEIECATTHIPFKLYVPHYYVRASNYNVVVLKGYHFHCGICSMIPPSHLGYYLLCSGGYEAKYSAELQSFNVYAFVHIHIYIY